VGKNVGAGVPPEIQGAQARLAYPEWFDSAGNPKILDLPAGARIKRPVADLRDAELDADQSAT